MLFSIHHQLMLQHNIHRDYLDLQQHLIYVNRFVAELGVCITANTLVIAVKVGLVGPYAKIGHV